MNKKDFNSALFRQKILKTDPEYEAIVYVETIYRIRDLEEKNCSCMTCQNELAKYREFFNKLKQTKQPVL